MQNPCFIIRALFMMLLFILSLFAILFSSATINLSFAASRAPLIFMICVNVVQLFLTAATLLLSSNRLPSIAVECSWAAVMSLLQIVNALILAVDYPAAAVCGQPSVGGICSLSTLLFPSAFFNSFFAFIYFSILFISSIAHRRIYSSIWYKNVYEIYWFCRPVSSKTADGMEDEHLWDSYLGDIENTSARKQRYAEHRSVQAAPWAQKINVRRGLDNPFAGGKLSRVSDEPRSKATLPSLPAQSKAKESHTRSTTESRFIERFRESRLLARMSATTRPQVPSYQNNYASPSAVVDHDLPIPLPHLSQWMRADQLGRPAVIL